MKNQQQEDRYSFMEWRVTLAQRRLLFAAPAEEECLNFAAGADPMVTEMVRNDGEKTKFTGEITVNNASLTNAMGRNLNRVAGSLESEATHERSAG